MWERKVNAKRSILCYNQLLDTAAKHMKTLQDKIEIISKNAKLYLNIILLQEEKAQIQMEANKNPEPFQKVVNLQKQRARNTHRALFSA